MEASVGDRRACYKQINKAKAGSKVTVCSFYNVKKIQGCPQFTACPSSQTFW